MRYKGKGEHSVNQLEQIIEELNSEQMNQFKTEDVHISTVSVGDTVLHYGKARTVGRENLSYELLMGHCIFGDSYRVGTKPVIKLVYQRVD